MKKYIVLFTLAAFAVAAQAGEDCSKTKAAACDASKAKVAAAGTCSASVAQKACCDSKAKKVARKATAKGAYNRG